MHSIGHACVPTRSKLMIKVERGPLACRSSPVTWASIPTGTSWPALGPLPIVRASRERLDIPDHSLTGPSSVTSAQAS